MTTISNASKGTSTTAYPTTWITPQEQLQLLLLPLTDKITVTVNSIPKDLVRLIVEYASEPILTDWYEALRQLDLLHIKIPPLPENIFQKVQETCPFTPSLNGKRRTVGDTHILTVIPQEFNNATIPFLIGVEYVGSFKYIKDVIWRELGKPVAQTHWELMTNGVLRESLGMRFDDQENLLLSKGKGNYQVPSFHGCITAIFCHKMIVKSNQKVSLGQRVFTNIQLKEENGDRIIVEVSSTERLMVMSNYLDTPSARIGMAGVIYL